MRDYRMTPTGTTPTVCTPSLSEACVVHGDDNKACMIAMDTARQEIPFKEIEYNQVTDDGLASRRSKHMVRTHAEVKAATGPEPALGFGLSLRAPLAGQCENDQWPYCVDRYGKQRS
jgi:hypothetical protein